MIIGGQAVLLYGEPRLTKDIDITLGIGPDKLPDVLSLARRLRLKILAEAVTDFVQQTLVLPVLDEKTRIRIDFIFSYSPYERQAVERAKSITLKTSPSASVQFAALEDIVIHKIIAGRPRDIEDVKSILLKNPEYDRQYITGWLKEFDESLGEGFVDAFLHAERDVK
jgi:hypothetical protein